jgi:hypothetical protein
MIGGNHSALSYKLPAGGKVGGTVNYPLQQNKIPFYSHTQTHRIPFLDHYLVNFRLSLLFCIRVRYVFSKDNKNASE